MLPHGNELAAVMDRMGVGISHAKVFCRKWQFVAKSAILGPCSSWFCKIDRYVNILLKLQCSLLGSLSNEPLYSCM